MNTTEEYLEAACAVLASYLDEQTGSTFEDGVLTTFDCSLDGNTVAAQINPSLDVLYAEATVTSYFPAHSPTVPNDGAYEEVLNEMVHAMSYNESLLKVLSLEGATLKLYSDGDSDTKQAILEVEHQEEEYLDVSEANEQEEEDSSPTAFSSSSSTHTVLLMPFASAILFNIILL